MKIENVKGYAWIIIVLSSFLLFYKYVGLVFPSLIVGDIKSHFNISSAEVGFLSGMMLYMILFVQPIAGMLLDKFGCRNVSTFSIMITAFGILLFASANSILLAYIGRAFMGVGVAFATVSYMKSAATWFDEKGFAVASTLLLTAAMTGAIVGQAPLAYMFEHTGWQTGLYYCAIIGVVVAIIYWLVVRDHPENRIEATKKDGVQQEKHSTKEVIFTVLKNKNNWLLMLYSGLIFTTIDAFGGLWGNSFFMQKYGLSSQTDAAYYISFIFIGMAVGAPLMGKLAAYIRCVPIMLTSTFVGFLTIVLILYVHLPFWLLAITCLVYGAATSAFMLVFVVGRKVNPFWVMATAVALINTGEPIFGGTFEGLVGMILDHLQPTILDASYTVDSFEKAFTLLPLSIVLAGIALLFVNEKQRD